MRSKLQGVKWKGFIYVCSAFIYIIRNKWEGFEYGRIGNYQIKSSHADQELQEENPRARPPRRWPRWRRRGAPVVHATSENPCFGCNCPPFLFVMWIFCCFQVGVGGGEAPPEAAGEEGGYASSHHRPTALTNWKRCRLPQGLREQRWRKWRWQRRQGRWRWR